MTFKFKNISIHYEIFGQGPAVVLLHGFLESSTMWNYLIPKLSEKNTVLILDFPGHGKSETVHETHSMELMADVVNSLLKELKIQKATFVGHSMGGYVALAYAEKYVDSVEKLILLNSTTAEDSEERKQNRDRSLEIVDKIPEAYISMAIGNLFAENSREKFASEIEKLKNEAKAFPMEGIKAAIRGMRDRKDRTSVLKNFPRGKYIISASEDPIIPMDEIKTISEKTGAKLKTLPGGHLSTVENGQAVSDYLLSVL
ncbi:alpha/beta fold hydrolase [Aequorivita echinoideorum]|uniref:Alpha/beta hydrolase n=1 Tax=Aequorivita echinoideorum TaxID=1549647 RepID=A0ABS5S162_9FLAO|nr:alpha/beta hydrolase [Aequorivita echinoideorum]MBT0606953.1 alpha/beta hydrolase [Aequorivita echinoideorum]